MVNGLLAVNRSLVINSDTAYGSLAGDKLKYLYLEPCFSVFSIHGYSLASEYRVEVI